MRILPISNSLFKTNRVSLKNPQTPKPQNIQDTFSFTGKFVSLGGKVEDINNREFPDELCFDSEKVLKIMENTRSLERWPRLRFLMADLFAKRCNYLGVTKKAKGGMVGFNNKQAVIMVSESTKKKYPKTIDFEWSEQYQEFEDFFEGNDFFEGAKTNIEELRYYLPELLKKYNWSKAN